MAAAAGRRCSGDLPDVRDPEQQRQLLLEQLERQQQQLGCAICDQEGQRRFLVVRNSLRNLMLTGIYIAGFQAMGRRRGF